MYLGNNYLRAFHGEWGTAWPGLQTVLPNLSWAPAVPSSRTRLLVPSSDLS